MKLYYSKGACSLTVRIVIHEVNASATFEAVNLKTKKTEDGKDYFTINPKGAVPALELDNGEVLTENIVIHQYLADKHHATHLLPAVNDFKRYRVLEWATYITTEVHKSFGALFNPNVPQELKEQIFKPMLIKKFEYIDAKLAKTKYIVDDEFRLADPYLFVMIIWLKFHQIDVAQWKNVSRYFALLQERESIKHSLNEEGLV